MMNMRKLKNLDLEIYQKPHSGKWYLPVCSAFIKDRLFRLSPNNRSNWEESDIDSVPTMCYVLTNKLVNLLNKNMQFTSICAILEDCLGSGPFREYFPYIWIRMNNIKAKARNTWECSHKYKRRKDND